MHRIKAFGNGVTKKRKRVALVLGFMALCVVGFSSTGAFFTDSHAGTITGNVGSIKVAVNGGTGAENLNFNWENMLPGVPNTADVTFKNVGANPQDDWIVFNNPTALSALNTLGTYGEVHIIGSGNPVFESANLNDRSSTCGPFSPSGCWPLGSMYKIANNLNPGDSSTVSFSFNYAGKLSTQPSDPSTAAFNPYPISGQVTTNAVDGSGSGLPYKIVATQHGQTP